MEDLNSNLDRIEMYLRGTLSQDELIIFEKELNTNSSFADELEKCRLEKDMANLLIAEDLRKKFEGPSELVKEKMKCPQYVGQLLDKVNKNFGFIE